jgi:hypothetical protein
MLDPWIIEEIRRREEEERVQREQRPAVEAPMEMPRYPDDRSREGGTPKVDRGVVIVDFTI